MLSIIILSLNEVSFHNYEEKKAKEGKGGGLELENNY